MLQKTSSLKISVIIGSHRVASNSEKIGLFAEKELLKLFPETQTYVFKLAKNPLPLWDEEKWTPESHWTSVWNPISSELMSSDGFVIVTPEWSGMVPSGLKNLFLLCDKGELAHKPGYLISVSAGTGGAYPIVELRSSSYKNTYINYLPEHLIVRQAGEVFVKETPDPKSSDEYLRGRLTYGLRLLHSYAVALKTVRGEGLLDLKKYPNGM